MIHDQIYKDLNLLIYAQEVRWPKFAQEVRKKRKLILELNEKNPGKLTIEQIERCKEELEVKPLETWILNLKNVLDEPAVGFYYDETVRFDENMAETGRDFLKARVLQVPFRTTFFHAKEYWRDYSKIDHVDLGFWVKNYEDQGKIVFYVSGGKLLPTTEYEINLIAQTESVKDVETDIIKTDEGDKYIFDAFYHMLMLLSHPYYNKEINETPEAVNKRRKAAGKSLLNKYIYVKMKPEIKNAISNSDGSIRRPHWRRGHIRRLRDGRITIVSPCIVNFDGYNAPEKKIYVVNKTLQHQGMSA